MFAISPHDAELVVASYRPSRNRRSNSIELIFLLHLNLQLTESFPSVTSTCGELDCRITAAENATERIASHSVHPAINERLRIDRENITLSVLEQIAAQFGTVVQNFHRVIAQRS
jgi:hypothetical protein